MIIPLLTLGNGHSSPVRRVSQAPQPVAAPPVADPTGDAAGASAADLSAADPSLAGSPALPVVAAADLAAVAPAAPPTPAALPAPAWASSHSSHPATRPARAPASAPANPRPRPAAPHRATHSQRGPASWYDAPSGTCAHPSLPFGTVVSITDTDNGRTATCTVEDRGPYEGGRIIDLAPDVFSRMAPTSRGVINVELSW